MLKLQCLTKERNNFWPKLKGSLKNWVFELGFNCVLVKLYKWRFFPYFKVHHYFDKSCSCFKEKKLTNVGSCSCSWINCHYDTMLEFKGHGSCPMVEMDFYITFSISKRPQKLYGLERMKIVVARGNTMAYPNILYDICL